VSERSCSTCETPDYLLEGTSGADRGIVQEVIAIVNEIAHGLRPGYDPLDDGVAEMAEQLSTILTE
jgi:hypothetical protein